MVMDNLSLDIDELNATAELESLMPAECVGSIYKDVNYNDNDGMLATRKVWQLQWDRLDQNMTSASSGEKFLYQSTHNIPAAGQMRRSTLKKQIDSFAKVKLVGRSPEDFVGVKHWIREVIENQGSRYEKAWWRTEALYKEGESYQDAIGGVSTSVNINAPVTVTDSKEESDPSVYDLLINTINGKTVRQALSALRAEEGIPPEMADAFQSGTLQDELIEQNFVKEVDSKFVKVE